MAAPGGQGPGAAPARRPGSSFQVKRAARTQGTLADDGSSSVSAGPPTSSSCWTNVRSTGAAGSARGAPPTGARATCGPSTSTCTAPGCSYKTQSLGLRLLGKVFFFFFFFLRVTVKLHVFTLEGKKKKLRCYSGAFWSRSDSYRQLLPACLPPNPPQATKEPGLGSGTPLHCGREWGADPTHHLLCDFV